MNDIEDFAAYCKHCTNAQLPNVYLKERGAGRNVTAWVAKNEAERRGVDTTDWPKLEWSK